MVRVHLLDTARDLLSIEKEDAEFKSWTFHDAMAQVEKEDSGVVILGYFSDGRFEAEEIFAKHDENYMPPELLIDEVKA